MISRQIAETLRLFLERVPITGTREAAAVLNCAAELDVYLEDLRRQATQKEQTK